MLNYLWGFMIVIGIVVGVLNGKIADVSAASINSAKEAISLCITMLGIMALWMGIMRVAKMAGIMDWLTKIIASFIKLLFLDIPRGHVVNEYIASNIVANILGLGSTYLR